MTAEARCDLSASLPSLPEAMAFVEDFGVRRGIAANDVLRLRLVVEELFANTATHGAAGEGEVQVRLALAAAPGEIELRYEDSAAPFDPLAHVEHSRAEPEAGGQRPPGGLGLVLVTQIAARVTYAREEGWNRVIVVLARER